MSYRAVFCYISLVEKHFIRNVMRRLLFFALLFLAAAQDAMAVDLTPNSNGGGNIPGTYRLVNFTMSNGNWADTVTLPADAVNNSTVVVSSTATWEAKISPQNVIFASTLSVLTGDSYRFRYRADTKRWYPVNTPVRYLTAEKLVGGVINRLTAPRTDVHLYNGNFSFEVTLPNEAGDRDKITVHSDAFWTSTINSSNLEFKGTLKLFSGAGYTFLFIKEKNLWVLQSSPRTHIVPHWANEYQLPDVKTPVTTVTAANGRWAPSMLLPINAKPGDQVIVQNTAETSFTVSAASANFSTVPINAGDKVRFVLGPDGQWMVETRTVTMLLVYSDAAAASLSEGAMQARMLESVRLTNEMLENSGANFYVKAVGFLKRQLADATTAEGLASSRTDAVIQQTRAQLAADAVYYGSVFPQETVLCGRGYLPTNVLPNRDYMFAVDTIACSPFMSHEFGHNMGLLHTSGPDVMGAMAFPLYSTPHRYTPDWGSVMGTEDHVSILNKNSQAASEIY